MVHFVVGIVKDEQAVARGVGDAREARTAVHQGHGAQGADGGTEHALARGKAAAVAGVEAEEQRGDEQDDRDDDQQLDQREALAGEGTGGHYWMAKTCAKADESRPSAD